MSIERINFGDIFTYKEYLYAPAKDYVYLAETSEIIYAAQILNLQISKDFSKSVNSISKSFEDVTSFKKPKLYFCFVELSTKGFKNRIANLLNVGLDEFKGGFFNKIQRLDNQDLKSILEEIKKSDDIDRVLKKLVASIKITDK